MPTTLPLRSVVLTLITPEPPRSLQAVFVGGSAFAVTVLGDGENQRAFSAAGLVRGGGFRHAGFSCFFGGSASAFRSLA